VLTIPMNSVGRRTIVCKLVIAALAVIWNVFGR
jgi:hypothetical protein